MHELRQSFAFILSSQFTGTKVRQQSAAVRVTCAAFGIAVSTSLEKLPLGLTTNPTPPSDLSCYKISFSPC